MINLLSMLQSFDGKLNNIEVYGLVNKQLSRPTNLFSSVSIPDDCMFVSVDVLAVNLSAYSSYLKSNGFWSNNGIYLVNGSICTLVRKDAGKFPDFYTVRGTLRYGSRTDLMYLAMLNFRKSGNDWYIDPTPLSDIEVSEWDKSDEVYENLMTSTSLGVVYRPPKLGQLPVFRAVEELPNVPKLDNNKIADEVQVKTYNAPVVKKESRSEILPFSEKYDKLFSLLPVSEFSKPAIEEDDKYLRILLDNLKMYFRHKPEPWGSTGRDLVSRYLEQWGSVAQRNYKGTTVKKYLLDIFCDEIIPFILGDTDSINGDGDVWDLCKTAFYNQGVFYGGIVQAITGIEGVDSSVMCNENPYLCEVEDREKLALCMGKAEDKSLDNWRGIYLIDDYIQKTGGSTMYTVSEIKNAKIGVRITKKQYETMTMQGTYLSKGVASNIRNYLGVTGSLGYNPRAFVSDGMYMVKPIDVREISKFLDEYVNSNLGVTFDGMVTSSSYLKKELEVYKYMWDIGNTSSGMKSEDIDKYIDEYEEIVGFKLEPEQRQAVHLLEKNGGIVAGSAGSGKTTTTACMKYCLERGRIGSVMFATPTGKAAKRLQEVVKEKCKTMDSMFAGYREYKNEIFFLDEGAMVTIDLLHRCISKMRNCKVYFFGDVAQLPPIGKGLPFKNLLKFMPCVFLAVSKRAKDGSAITLNADIINETMQPLQPRDDFEMIGCSDEDIQRNCIEQVQRFTEMGYALDDIQVVSPLGVARYSWGTTKMNTVLQPIFNSTRGYNNTYTLGFTNFVIGDRVIHTKRNVYGLQWYKRLGAGVYKKIYGCGVCNGEVGKLVEVVDDIRILSETDDKPDDFEYHNTLRNDESYGGSFVSVMYHDYIEDEDYYVLYRCEGKEHEYKGEDLAMLELFYAGTTHKLQGSQAKVVLCLLGTVNFDGFITRNMLYTMITRGSERVVVIGKITDRYRRNIATDSINTIGEYLCG